MARGTVRVKLEGKTVPRVTWHPAGGDYRPGVGANRTAQEQHPFHFHGHHFWVLGHGAGLWNASAASRYNLLDAPFRDSYTVFKDGWTAIRFRARSRPCACKAACSFCAAVTAWSSVTLDMRVLASPTHREGLCDST